MKIAATLLCALLAACTPHLNILPSQRVKNPRAEDIAGCYIRNSGSAWILLREDRSSKFGGRDGSNESSEKWYIDKSTVLFGDPNDVKFWSLDVYLVPGAGLTLSDGVSLFRSASAKSCSL